MTIADLARDLKVSPATISNTINGKGKVSETTRARILNFIAERGYVPSHAAKSLRTGRSQTLGLIVPNIVNPVFPLMAREVGREAAARGQAVILMESQDDLAKQTLALANLQSRDVDAIILVACRGTEDVPDGVVLIDAPGNPRSDVSSDHFLGGQLAARHLLELGHTRLAVLAGPLTSLVARERYQGAVKVLADAGLTFVHTHHSSYGLDQGEQYAVHEYRPGAYSAVYAVSDSLAVGLIRGLNARGLRVPDDLSVMGFDDVGWAELITPPLSTIRQNIPAIARFAVQRASGEAGGPRAVPVELVARRSTAALLATGLPPPDSAQPADLPPPSHQRSTP